jgi:hypothetical protein
VPGHPVCFVLVSHRRNGSRCAAAPGDRFDSWTLSGLSSGHAARQRRRVRVARASGRRGLDARLLRRRLERRAHAPGERCCLQPDHAVSEGLPRCRSFLPVLSTRRRRQHCKNPNAAGRKVWVTACNWVGSSDGRPWIPGCSSRNLPLDFLSPSVGPREAVSSLLLQATPTDTSGTFPRPGLPPTDAQTSNAIAGGLCRATSYSRWRHFRGRSEASRTDDRR